MTSFNQIRRQELSGQTGGVARFFAGLGRSLARLGGLRAGAIEEAAVFAAPPSEALARAIEVSSNIEMDWLWAATQVSLVSERRYCLRRALEINPESQMALRDLDKIGW